MDWHAIFGISQPVAETILRGSAVYWFLFLIFRFVMRRDVGSVGIADVLVLVIIADAAQNGMAGEYRSVTDGFILITTIVFWNVSLDWMSFRFPRLGRFAAPGTLQLVKDGRILHRNMRRELLTEDELMSKVREKGMDKLSEVKDAYMESDGTITVIAHDNASSGSASR